MPMFRVRYSSCVSSWVATSRTSWNSGGIGHEPRSTRASQSSGSTRGRFSGSPPPVMWASAFTFPPANAAVNTSR